MPEDACKDSTLRTTHPAVLSRRGWSSHFLRCLTGPAEVIGK